MSQEFEFARRGIDSPISFKSVADNFRDYTLFAVFLKCAIVAVKGAPALVSALLFFPILLVLPILFMALVARTYFILYAILVDGQVLNPTSIVIAKVAAALWALSVVYIIYAGLPLVFQQAAKGAA